MANVQADKTDAARSDAGKSEHGPIIIDLGRQNKKRIRRLRKGKGRLFARVQETNSQLASQGLGDSQVIVVVSKKKGGRRRGRWYRSAWW